MSMLDAVERNAEAVDLEHGDGAVEQIRCGFHEVGRSVHAAFAGCRTRPGRYRPGARNGLCRGVGHLEQGDDAAAVVAAARLFGESMWAPRITAREGSRPGMRAARFSDDPGE